MIGLFLVFLFTLSLESPFSTDPIGFRLPSGTTYIAIRCRFADTTNPTEDTFASAATMSANFADARAWHTRCSYGDWTFGALEVHDTEISLQAHTYYDNQDPSWPDTVACYDCVQLAGVDVYSYDVHWCYFSEPDSKVWSFNGRAVSWDPYFDPKHKQIHTIGSCSSGLIKHENGHLLGLRHSSSLKLLPPLPAVSAFGPPTIWDEYGDPFSRMGNPSDNNHFSVHHKLLLGWLDFDLHTDWSTIDALPSDGSLTTIEFWTHDHVTARVDGRPLAHFFQWRKEEYGNQFVLMVSSGMVENRPAKAIAGLGSIQLHMTYDVYTAGNSTHLLDTTLGRHDREMDWSLGYGQTYVDPLAKPPFRITPLYAECRMPDGSVPISAPCPGVDCPVSCKVSIAVARGNAVVGNPTAAELPSLTLHSLFGPEVLSESLPHKRYFYFAVVGVPSNPSSWNTDIDSMFGFASLLHAKDYYVRSYINAPFITHYQSRAEDFDISMESVGLTTGKAARRLELAFTTNNEFGNAGDTFYDTLDENYGVDDETGARIHRVFWSAYSGQILSVVRGFLNFAKLGEDAGVRRIEYFVPELPGLSLYTGLGVSEDGAGLSVRVEEYFSRWIPFSLNVVRMEDDPEMSEFSDRASLWIDFPDTLDMPVFRTVYFKEESFVASSSLLESDVERMETYNLLALREPDSIFSMYFPIALTLTSTLELEFVTSALDLPVYISLQPFCDPINPKREILISGEDSSGETITEYSLKTSYFVKTLSIPIGAAYYTRHLALAGSCLVIRRGRSTSAPSSAWASVSSIRIREKIDHIKDQVVSSYDENEVVARDRSCLRVDWSSSTGSIRSVGRFVGEVSGYTTPQWANNSMMDLTVVDECNADEIVLHRQFPAHLFPLEMPQGQAAVIPYDEPVPYFHWIILGVSSALSLLVLLVLMATVLVCAFCRRHSGSGSSLLTSELEDSLMSDHEESFPSQSKHSHLQTLDSDVRSVPAMPPAASTRLPVPVSKRVAPSLPSRLPDRPSPSPSLPSRFQNRRPPPPSVPGRPTGRKQSESSSTSLNRFDGGGGDWKSRGGVGRRGRGRGRGGRWNRGGRLRGRGMSRGRGGGRRARVWRGGGNW